MKFFNLLMSLVLFGVWVPFAQAKSVTTHSFNPGANPSYVVTEDALLGATWNKKENSDVKGRLFFSAFYDFVNDPLVELDSTHSSRTNTLVDSLHSLDLTFGYNILSNLQLGAATAMSIANIPPKTGQFGMDDSRVFGKWRLNRQDDPVAFALMPEVWIPTGSSAQFLTNDSVGVGIHLIAERDFGPVIASANAGFRYFNNAQFRDLDKRSAVPLSLGILVPIDHRWGINLEGSGAISIPSNRYVNPTALYGGVRYRLPGDVIFTVGGAVGSFNSYSGSDYRIYAGVIFMPTLRERATPAPERERIVYIKQAPEKARVVFTEKELIISQEVQFENASAVLTESGRNLLDEVAYVLKENRHRYRFISIEGHTNSIGKADYNQKLSERRAASVKAYLVSKGLEHTSLKTVGYGKTRPKIKNTKDRDLEMAVNRRVEFKVVK